MDSLSSAEEQISKIEHLGADFKNNTMKQESHQEYYCFLLLFVPIGREKQYFTYFLLVGIQLFTKKTILVFIEILVLLFYCF